ncbi:hypothetical protein CAP48_14985 [Advenella sp. S44]|uniref:aldehyde dehydrogenase family protein n=1 Tax=Advenella sp. S44 TaxID=1982755 RepID=UPI000C2AF5D7|nr:aldehyde dehydrogenase family protein [Advenella sp. S44]PJX22235.1 hypothetical protein CAP48_14985 [Advenella sp. S44]
MKNYELFINGIWHAPDSGRYFDCISPYDASIWAKCPIASAAQVEDAVESASIAFDSSPWTDYLPAKRGELLRELGRLIEQHVDELCKYPIFNTPHT